MGGIPRREWMASPWSVVVGVVVPCQPSLLALWLSLLLGGFDRRFWCP